jgi:hypothetical protein
MNALDEYTYLSRIVTNLEREKAEAQGAIKLLLQTLEKDFNCPTAQHGAKLAAKLQKEQQELDEQWTAALAELKENFPQLQRRTT